MKVGGPPTAAVIKPQEVSLLLLQALGDDLVDFSSFTDLVVTCTSCFLNTVSDKPRQCSIQWTSDTCILHLGSQFPGSLQPMHLSGVQCTNNGQTKNLTENHTFLMNTELKSTYFYVGQTVMELVPPRPRNIFRLRK